MADDRDRKPTLRVIPGGKSRVRKAYEACRAGATAVLDLPIIGIPSPEDEEYAAEVAQLVTSKA